MYRVQIQFGDEWYDLTSYQSRDAAEWAIAKWRQNTGHLPQKGDLGFRVRDDSPLHTLPLAERYIDEIA